MRHTVAAAAHDKEARLCLAVLHELGEDAACPAVLKSLLPAKETSPEATDPRQRLRASMSHGDKEPHSDASPRGGLLRRIFGF